MSSLLALLSQHTPNLQTRKGLILLGLQNDFVSRDGKLPVRDTGYLDRLIHFISDFRQFGHLIWVRSEFESTRPVNDLETPGDTVIAGGSSGTDHEVPSAEKPSQSVPSKRFKVAPDFYSEELDFFADEPIKSSAKSSASCSKPDEGQSEEELFLSRTSTREPCCVKGTRGAEYADRIKPLVQEGKDMQVVKTHYSAFGGTSLLLTLRSKLITELYVAGNMTNLSVYATAMDAARYGIRIILVEDCLGYRRQDRHKLAIKQLCDIMEADVMSSKDAIRDLRDPPEDDDRSEESEKASDEASDDGQEGATHSTRELGALEVDSDDIDGDVELPIVRPGTLGRMNGQAPNGSGKGSLSAASQAHASKYPQSSSVGADRCDRDHKYTARTFHGQHPERVKPRLDTGTGHERRLGYT